MNIPLPASIKGLVALIVLLAMLPALALIVFSASIRVTRDVESMRADVRRTAAVVMARQEHAVENTRILLMTLARLKEVRDSDAEACSALFHNLLLHSPVYSNIRLLGLDGTALAEGAPGTASNTDDSSERFNEALSSTGVTFHVRPRPSRGEAPLVNCLYPVREHNRTPGLLVASLRIALSPAELLTFSSQHVEHLHIVDKDGTVVFGHPREECEGSLEGHTRDKTWQTIRDAPETNGAFLDNQDNYIVFDKLSLHGRSSPDLTLILTVSTRSLYLQAARGSRSDVLFLGAALLIALLTTLWLTNSALIRPVKSLLARANQIKEGDLTVRPSNQPLPQELKILADSLDSMAVSLSSRDEELITAGDAAIQAGRIKTDFLANMSHEIRTPMNAILGMTYLTRQGELTGQQRSYLDTIHNEANKLLVIINDILDFSKIEAGKFHIEHIAFALPPLLNEVIAKATEEAAGKQLDLAAALPLDLPHTVVGDPLHLRQVLSNILSSAVRLTRAGGLGLICHFERSAEGREDFEFRIRDTKGGMDTQALATMFEDQSSNEGKKGMADGFALNLAVTRKLVRLMQGDLNLMTVPNGPGTSIILRLPLPEAAIKGSGGRGEAGQGPAQAAHAGHDPTGQPLAQVRILLVEDNPVNQQIAQEILAGFGARVSTASNGREALEHLERAAPEQLCHIVLMDLQMPDMDGLEATRRIRQDQRFSALPIIAMTAQTHDEEWSECARAGMNDFVSKPIDVPMLLSVLLKWLPAPLRQESGKPRP